MHKKKSGFSLIELSVVLIVIGVLLVGILQAYRVYDEKQKIERMKLAMATVEQGIKNFPNMVDPATIDPATGIGQPYGRLPCPAPMNATGTGNDFDSENCAMPTFSSTNPDVMVGKIPAATLGLHNDSMRDAYGKYFLYAVSRTATSASTYGVTPGQITVIEEGYDQDPASSTSGEVIPVETHSNVQFAVISMGRDNQGAYAFDGSQPSPCPASSIKQHENCNGDDIFLSSYRHDANTDDDYDDNIVFASNLTAIKTEEPRACEQIELFSTNTVECPEGWSEEILPRELTDFQYHAKAHGYYNEDPETGEYFFTTTVTPYTTVTQIHTTIRRTCRKNTETSATTRCFGEKIVKDGGNVNDPCPDGWLPISDYENPTTPTCGRM